MSIRSGERSRRSGRCGPEDRCRGRCRPCREIPDRQGGAHREAGALRAGRVPASATLRMAASRIVWRGRIIGSPGARAQLAGVSVVLHFGCDLNHGSTMRHNIHLPSATFLAGAFSRRPPPAATRGSQQPNGAPAREIQLAPVAPAQPQLNDAPAPAAAAARGRSRPAPRSGRCRRPERHGRRPAAAAGHRPPAECAGQRRLLRRRLPRPPPARRLRRSRLAARRPAPATGVVSAGTAFAVHPVARVCTNTFKPGDRFTATLDEVRGGIRRRR